MLAATISASQGQVNYLHGGLQRTTIDDRVFDIIHKLHIELVALCVPDNYATQATSSKSLTILAKEKGILSYIIFIYIMQIMYIFGGKAIAALETALNKMKLYEAAKDPQQSPAIANDSLANTFCKAVQEARRNENGMNARSNESTSERQYSDSNCVHSEYKQKRQRKEQGDRKVSKRFLENI